MSLQIFSAPELGNAELAERLRQAADQVEADGHCDYSLASLNRGMVCRPTMFMAEDLVNLYTESNLPLDTCSDLLGNAGKRLNDRLCELGFEVLGDLVYRDDVIEAEAENLRGSFPKCCVPSLDQLTEAAEKRGTPIEIMDAVLAACSPGADQVAS